MPGRVNLNHTILSKAIMAQVCRRPDMLPGSWGHREKENLYVIAAQWVGIEMSCRVSLNKS